MAVFEPNLVLDGYAFLMEVELGEWSRFSRGFRARDEEGNLYILELVPRKRQGMDRLLEINHKTILNCLAIKQTEDGRWIQIFEYFPGETLRDLLIAGEEFSYLDIAIICFQICNGLSALHGLELIHEDFRPENIIINSNGEVKLKGTLIPEVLINYVNIPEIWNYIAPEQITKSTWVKPGPNSNVYSLGSVIYELLIGRRYGKPVEELEMAIKTSRDAHLALRSQIERFPQPALPQTIPEEFINIILNALIVDADNRIDIKTMSDILATFINNSLAEVGEGQSPGVNEESETVIEPPEEEIHVTSSPSLSEETPLLSSGEEPIIPEQSEEIYPAPSDELKETEESAEPHYIKDSFEVRETEETPYAEGVEEIEKVQDISPLSSTPRNRAEVIPYSEEERIEPLITPEEFHETAEEIQKPSPAQETLSGSSSVSSQEKIFRARQELSEEEFYDRETRELSHDEMLGDLKSPSYPLQGNLQERYSTVKEYSPFAEEEIKIAEEQHPSEIAPDDPSQIEDEFEEEGPDVKEFIPSVSGGFFSREKIYEKSDYASDGELIIEHPFQSSLKSAFPPDYIDEGISKDSDSEKISEKIDVIIDEIRSFEKKTSAFMEKFYKEFRSGIKGEDKTEVFQEITKIKILLSVFFSRPDKISNLSGLDSIDTGGLSLRHIIDFYSAKGDGEAVDSTEKAVLELTTLRDFIEKITIFLASPVQPEKKLYGEEDFLEAFSRRLDFEYRQLIAGYNDNKNLEIKEGFFKAIEGFEFFLPPDNMLLKQEIMAYIERFTFIFQVLSFYRLLKQQGQEEMENFFGKYMEFLNTKIFSGIKFKNEFPPERIDKEHYELYTSFPDKLRFYVMGILKNEIGILPLEVKKEEYFDFDRHHIMGKISTTEASKNYKISEMLARGYIYKEKVLKKVDVKIYIYKE